VIVLLGNVSPTFVLKLIEAPGKPLTLSRFLRLRLSLNYIDFNIFYSLYCKVDKGSFYGVMRVIKAEVLGLINDDFSLVF